MNPIAMEMLIKSIEADRRRELERRQLIAPKRPAEGEPTRPRWTFFRSPRPATSKG